MRCRTKPFFNPFKYNYMNEKADSRCCPFFHWKNHYYSLLSTPHAQFTPDLQAHSPALRVLESLMWSGVPVSQEQ